MRKIFLLSFILFFCFWSDISAFEDVDIEYKDVPVLDSDLDGLTDLGEEKIFKTDPKFPDSDNDGFLDGAEVLGGTDPSDSKSPSAKETYKSLTYPAESKIPWGWYTTRVTGLIGFLLLYLSFFLGLLPRIPIISRLIEPFISLKTHCWISLQALIFSLVHVFSLFFEHYFHFSWADIFIPFFSEDFAFEIFLGQTALLIMFILVLSSYLSRFFSFKAWRLIHFLNLILFVVVIFHALSFGTDLKEESWGRVIFIGLNVFLAFLILYSLVSLIIRKIRARQNAL